IDSAAFISTVDLLGDGTACLVWASPLPGKTSSLRYIHLMKNGKPHLLTRVVNNMGAETIITYAPSTKFYLQDKLAGNPWVTKLHFPVHVVERVETIDHIGKNRLVNKYAYHHGYYDGHEREFRGFGMVEQWDTESFEECEDCDGIDTYVAPIHTKTWFHNGAHKHDSKISKVYEQEYWKGDGDAFHLPDTVLPELETDEMLEAIRALRGSVLRTEVYEAGDEASDVPYQVTETNFAVHKVQPKGNNRHGVFFTNAHETITFHYEQNADDPRIGHEFVLEVDAFGNVKKVADLVYPRRSGSGVHGEQLKPYMTAQATEFINETDDLYLIGVPYESKGYEIGGNLPVTAGERVTFEDVQEFLELAISDANTIPYHGEFVPGASHQSRLISWSRHYFWNEDQSGAGGLGEIVSPVLPHHEENAVFTPELISQVFDSGISDTDITSAGYYLNEHYYWNRGAVQFYQSGDFYLPVRMEDPLGGSFDIEYDTYNLAQIAITDAMGNETSASIDYRTLHPWHLTDPNENMSEALTDPLGMVIATSIYGTENGIDKGDAPLDEYDELTDASIEAIVSNPEDYLQDATTFFFYDLHAWTDRAEPPQFIALARETHISDLAGGETSRIQISLGYSDGFERELQSKIKVERGLAWVRQDNDEYEEEEVEDRWLVSGRTVYNNKQEPVKQYEPFYSATHEYEPEQFFAELGVTPIIHYDPLMRVVKTDLPDGHSTSVEFTPWEVESYDQNDNETGHDHFNTPQVAILDTLGREFRVKQYLEDKNTATGDQIYETVTTFDITGNPLTITDPRGNVAFTYTYDMAGHPLRTQNIDAGDDRIFIDVMENPVLSFDSRGHKVTVVYDELHRPVLSSVSGNGLDNITERVIYGESVADAATHNLRGQMYQHYDQAGLVTIPSYSFKGEPKRSEQKIRTEYKLEANWAEGEEWDVLLESETFITELFYDALGHVTEQYAPDESVTKPEYHLSGTLNGVEVKLRGESDFTRFVDSISYNAKGQREKIEYGNSTETHYTYEPETFRLIGLKTVRTSDNTDLQDISYTYDPVGNITHIEDNTHGRIFHDGEIVDPDNDFVYDALYRLTEAVGREHLGLNNPILSNHDKFKQSILANLNDSHQLAKYRRNYTYDKSGNLTQIKHETKNSTRSFTRNLVVASGSNRAIPDSMGSDVAPFFDLNGNMTALEHLAGIDWNYRDNISKATIIERTGSTDDAEYYVYNSGGDRVRKLKETLEHGHVVIEEKLYLGGVEIKRIRTESSLTLERFDHHVMDDTSRIAIVNHWIKADLLREVDSSDDLNQNKVRYQYGNHLGSASLELDSEGQLISYEEYFPYGGTSFVVGNSEKEVKLKEYRYTGKERDDATGLYYYGARYYAPWIGRWLSADPIVRIYYPHVQQVESGMYVENEAEDETIEWFHPICFKIGCNELNINLYKFCSDNPITMIDTDGLFPNRYSGPLLIDSTGKIYEDGKNVIALVGLPGPSGRLFEITAETWINENTEFLDNVEIIYAKDFGSVEEIMSEIKEKFGEDGIDRIAYFGHSSPTALSVFYGSTEIEERWIRPYTSWEGIKFRDGAEIYLFGCNAATAGEYSIAQFIAKETGVKTGGYTHYAIFTDDPELGKLKRKPDREKDINRIIPPSEKLWLVPEHGEEMKFYTR
ncbi:toxin TcdB middle/N-terminal domain-containing protein, partial [Chitinispirillales bacterium ANBcel5]|uniref:toxin TcdB middle/N-terminal domain-containing protein n=1 Tax=Cellulosispirillum alkaliphilum TaxID=3039283 RepID=UPI002A58185A|nr:toxin TcdB middle/N-terminal domain-containing protein [Chitinispirillales bacterium ANBcel5]